MTAPAGVPAFDPLEELFVAQFRKPPGLMAINLRVLSPFQRALLVIDGTVTKFIEAYAMEPVDVSLLSQEVRTTAADDEWLELPAGAPVIAREVALRGRYRHQVYAYAPSLLVLDRLPQQVREALSTNPGGLGRILLQTGLESRREVLWYGRERLAEVPAGVEGLRPGYFISRTYRIIAGGRPVMLINEKFPTGVDPLPSPD
jgi:chorismate-pyruvate lyase